MSSSKDNDSYKINRFDIVRGRKVIRLRSNEKAYGSRKEMAKLIGPDMWFTSDIHINQDTERTDLIISHINSKVDKDDHLMFLGDIGHKRDGTFDTLSEAINRIKCKNKYLILGNHDMYTINDYVSMGFKFVDTEVTIPYGNGKILFTHVPFDLTQKGYHNVINVHGHFHGSNTYYDVDAKNHYDDFLFWDETYVRSRLITRPPVRGYPPVQQLKDLLRWIYTWD